MDAIEPGSREADFAKKEVWGLALRAKLDLRYHLGDLPITNSLPSLDRVRLGVTEL
jgi:hypothetical protein